MSKGSILYSFFSGSHISALPPIALSFSYISFAFSSLKNSGSSAHLNCSEVLNINRTQFNQIIRAGEVDESLIVN